MIDRMRHMHILCYTIAYDRADMFKASVVKQRQGTVKEGTVRLVVGPLLGMHMFQLYKVCVMHSVPFPATLRTDWDRSSKEQ